MAATVATHVLQTQKPAKYYAATFLNVYVDAAETNVVKVDKSTLTGPDGTEPTMLAIEKVQWSIGGYTSVKISFDHTTDINALVLAPGQGEMDFSAFGGLQATGSGGAGDILFTTAGTTATNNYQITLLLRKID